MELLAKFNNNHQKGFTLIELLLVLGIIAIIFTATVPVFLNLYQKRDLTSQTRDLIANLEEARDKSMTDGSDFGVYFEVNSFTTFRGSSFQEADQIDEFEISENLDFSEINLAGNQIVFQSPTGEVKDYDVDHSKLVISNQAGESKSFVINRLGVVDVN